MKSWNNKRRGGFTLVELLVVIGIIVVLIGIMLPAISKIRLAAKATATDGQIKKIMSAIENYRQAHQSFPGPQGLTNVTTGTENLVLGLIGANGKGPVVRQGHQQRIADPYIQPATGELSKGKFQDEQGRTCSDTNIPEFVDQFNDPLPILYLRARIGIGGIYGSGQHYDPAEVAAYVNSDIGGGGHSFSADYFKDLNSNGPRSKDTYILISAGADRKYGTEDDICSFGRPGY